MLLINCRDCGKTLALEKMYVAELGGYRCLICHEDSDDTKRIAELKAKLAEIMGWE